MLSVKDVEDRFETIVKDNSLCCTEAELNEFLMYGYLLQSGDKYITRNGNILNVEVLKIKQGKFNLDFTGLITKCEELAAEAKVKRVYCLSKSTLDKYVEAGLIIEQNGKKYYRLFDKELWLVYEF